VKKASNVSSCEIGGLKKYTWPLTEVEQNAYERSKPGDVGLSPFFTVNWTKAEQGCQMAYFQTKNTYLGKF
jgi:hypothetical protein